nr:MAG TPA: hypothetical protein [Caudoviricetes sp.]
MPDAGTASAPADETMTMPFDRELQEILMQVHNSRRRLIAYVDSIHDRKTYEVIHEWADTAGSDLSNAISAISQITAELIAFRLTKTD